MGMIRQNNHEVRELQMGAVVLAAVGYAERIPKALWVSLQDFSRLRDEPSVQPFGNSMAERKILVFLDALHKAVSTGGEATLESILRDVLYGDTGSGICGLPIIQVRDIPAEYWHQQEQLFREHGAIFHIHADDKVQAVQKLQDTQMDSIRPWETYLTAKDCPYPLWFRLYTVDGLSRMGRREGGHYTKRSSSTVAPYPKFDAAALAKVYQKTRDRLDEDGLPETFEKSYATAINDVSVPITLPDNPSEVRGEWMEYRLGDEDALSRAAEGTPWCIVSPSVGRGYLTYGHYVGNNNGVSDDDGAENGACFYLFHPIDPDTGALSSTAVASVRLGTDGCVAEISGRRRGQNLESAVIPSVRRKVESLPGGAEFMPRFDAKLRLIDIERRWRAGEDITDVDTTALERDIAMLKAYNTYDPIVNELRLTALPSLHGMAAEDVYRQMAAFEQTEFGYPLLMHGLKLEAVQNPVRMTIREVRTVSSHTGSPVPALILLMQEISWKDGKQAIQMMGCPVELILPKVNDLSVNLADVLQYVSASTVLNVKGFNPTVQDVRLIAMREPDVLDDAVAHMRGRDISGHVGELCSLGVSMAAVLERLDFCPTVDDIRAIHANHPEGINTAVLNMSASTVYKNLQELLELEASANALLSVCSFFPTLTEVRVIIQQYPESLDTAVECMRENDVHESLMELLDLGASADAILSVWDFHPTNEEVRAIVAKHPEALAAAMGRMAGGIHEPLP